MIFGVFLVIAGVLIALFPQLLSLIVAAVLIAAGVLFFALGYTYRRVGGDEDNVTTFFFRF